MVVKKKRKKERKEGADCERNGRPGQVDDTYDTSPLLIKHHDPCPSLNTVEKKRVGKSKITSIINHSARLAEP